MIKDFRPPINLQTEVHERQATRDDCRNILLFVADAEQKGVKIYFFRNGIFAGRIPLPWGVPRRSVCEKNSSPSSSLRAEAEEGRVKAGKRKLYLDGSQPIRGA